MLACLITFLAFNGLIFLFGASITANIVIGLSVFQLLILASPKVRLATKLAAEQQTNMDHIASILLISWMLYWLFPFILAFIVYAFITVIYNVGFLS